MSDDLRLKDVCAQIVDCEHRTAPKAAFGQEYAYSIGTPNIRDGRLQLSAAKRVDKPTYESWAARQTPRKGDIILTREAPVGEAAFIDGSVPICLGQRTVLLRPDPSRVSPRYLHYRLLSPGMQERLRSRSEGSTVAHLNVADIRGITLGTLPPLAEQQKTAKLLGALDDKITVNDRIAGASVRLAQAIFTSLNIGVEPGQETFGEVASVHGGGTPRTSEPGYWDGGIAWTTPSDVTALHAPYLFKTERTISGGGLANCASQLYPAGSIFMTSRATIGAFAIPQIPAAVNQGFVVVVPPKPELRWWLFHEMRSRVDEMLSLANGSTFLELSRSNFRQMPVRLPSPEVIARFHERVDPLHRKAVASEAESTTLRELRDALLPKLMSGEIRVREAEQIVEGAT